MTHGRDSVSSKAVEPGSEVEEDRGEKKGLFSLHTTVSCPCHHPLIYPAVRCISRHLLTNLENIDMLSPVSFTVAGVLWVKRLVSSEIKLFHMYSVALPDIQSPSDLPSDITEDSEWSAWFSKARTRKWDQRLEDEADGSISVQKTFKLREGSIS